MTTLDVVGDSLAAALEPFWPDATPENFVAGRWTHSAERAGCIDPSTGQTYTSAPVSTVDEVQAAVDSARDAQPAWAALPLSERIEALDRLRAALLDRAEDLALLESIDSGNPLASTRRDMTLAARYLKEWPAHALTFAGRASRPHPDGFTLVTHEPYGVVGRIIAYNHPSLFALAGSIFPLLAGNTVVIKAAAQTPVATLALGALLEQAMPPGVVNLVAGDAVAGDALSVHPHIKRLSFVGSGATALRIQSRLSVSGLVKHFTAELGGKNPMIVCSDVDLDAAVDAALAGTSFLISQGQSCQSTARLLVHDEIHDEFVGRLVDKLGSIRVGHAYDEKSDMGPLVSADHLARVEGFVQTGVREGCTLATGGGRPSSVPSGGYYLEPTLFTDVPSNSVLAREEIFGPVAIVQRWTDEARVVDMANDVALGLSAAVWTRDIDRALRIASRLQAGYVWVNDANRHYPGAPFGGHKASGTGREECAEEFASYFEPKAINIKVTP